MKIVRKISIIVDGSWGSALDNLLIDNKNDVLVYDNDESTVSEINEFHTNKSKLGNNLLSIKIKATTSLEDTLNFSSIIVLAIPTSVTRIVLSNIKKIFKEKKLLVNVAQGLEFKSNDKVSQIVYSEISL